MKFKLEKIIFLFFLAMMLLSCKSNIRSNANLTSDNQETLPREIMNHYVVNHGVESNIPKMTVSKFIELAERFQSCQCAAEKFVNYWIKGKREYKLISFFNKSEPITFICNSETPRGSCYIKEIDRGEHIKDLKARFASGNELIKYIYDNGIMCKNNKPCVE